MTGYSLPTLGEDAASEHSVSGAPNEGAVQRVFPQRNMQGLTAD